MATFNVRMREFGMQTRAAAMSLPEPLRTAELTYLDRRDAYLAVTIDIVQKQEAQAWAIAAGDRAYRDEVNARIGALGATLANELGTVRRTGEHAFGLAFRMAMREILNPSDVACLEEAADRVAGAKPVALPGIPGGREGPGVLTFVSPQAWLQAIQRERKALLVEHVRATRPRKDEIQRRLRGLDSQAKEQAVRLSTARYETVEIMVEAVARWMMAKPTYCLIEDRAEEILGRVKNELVHKAKANANGGRPPLDMRDLAYLPPFREVFHSPSHQVRRRFSRPWMRGLGRAVEARA